MDKLPSQSLSKPLLLATPLFVIVLAVLNASDQLSYLFVLKFITNVGSQADITFIPTMQPQTKDPFLNDDLLLESFSIKPNLQYFGYNQTINPSPIPISQTPIQDNQNIPLVNITTIQQWAKTQKLVRGVSPRWLIPAMSQTTDILLLFSNIQHQKQIGLGVQANLQPLLSDQVAISSEIKTALGIEAGQKIKIQFKLSNLFQGSKLIEKNQQHSSAQQYVTQKPDMTFNSNQIAKQLAKNFDLGKYGIKQQDLAKVLKNIYEDKLNLQYTVSQDFYPQGMYPSVLHNVVLLNYNQIQKVIANFIIQEIKVGVFDSIIPQQFQLVWKKLKKTKVFQTQITQSVKQYVQQFCLMSVVTLYRREQIYHPDKPLKNQFSQLLESSPTNVDVIVIYPIYQDSLAIKFFFQSIMQIFTFVACMLFYYTMTLVMKQLYQQKQIEVGLWRTLGAGGVRNIHQIQNQQQVDMNNQQNQRFKRKSVYKRPKLMQLKEKLFYSWQILVKVGFLYYWLLSSIISIILYITIKYFLFMKVCQVLHFQQIAQSISSPTLIFVCVFLFVQGLAIFHINKIYNNPLVQTIKPVKRTFDLVKVRMINLSTFGISADLMMIAGMLVYYGVTAYYLIPFAVLDDNNDLQIILFNSIFVFMIFGSVLLVSVLQSRIQVLILLIIFKINSKFKKMKMIMLKNIKAKQYKNIKVSVIISLTFAFLLFFSSGIKIQIKIIQSFVQRALGADLVMQNYQKETFNTTKVSNFLDSKGLQYAWLSKNINRNGVYFQIQSSMIDKQSKPGFKIISSNYLNSTFQQYYVPWLYYDNQTEPIIYDVLPDGLRNGFRGIQTEEGKSVSKFNPNDTFINPDPLNLNVKKSSVQRSGKNMQINMAPKQQIINMVVSQKTQKDLGQSIGTIYKLVVKYGFNEYQTRARIVHAFKAGPGFDLLQRQCFISEQQAKYLYKIINANQTQLDEKQKLFIRSNGQGSLNGIGQSIVAMSPDHTQLFDMSFVTQSFSLLTHYLDLYVILITIVMAILTIIFLSIYTVGKCRDEAEMFKMLRAIGLGVKDIRHMIFLQILIRLVVAIVDGILLGVIFSIGFSKQIQQFLMIHTPPMDLTVILMIAGILIIVFGFAVSFSTRYLSKRTVLETTKL